MTIRPIMKSPSAPAGWAVKGIKLVGTPYAARRRDALCSRPRLMYDLSDGYYTILLLSYAWISKAKMIVSYQSE